VTTSFEPLPLDLASAHALILAQRELLEQEQAARIVAQSEAKVRALEVERLKLLLAKARREAFGQSSERAKLLVEQLELAIEDLEEAQGAEEAKADLAAPKAGKTRAPRGPRGPHKLPENLPVERIVEPAPCACGKCGGLRLHKLGEEVTKTLECEPRRWKIIEHVREKFTCRDCDAITETPAPSHPIPRGFAGPSLLAMVLVNKFLLHQPLNLQSATFSAKASRSTRRRSPIGSAPASSRSRPFSTRCVVTCSPPNGSTLTTLRFRCWRRRRPGPAASGSICATIGPSADRRRRLLSSNIRRRAMANIPALTFPAGPASCRPTPSPDSTSSMTRSESRDRF
jgi:transposase